MRVHGKFTNCFCGLSRNLFGKDCHLVWCTYQFWQNHILHISMYPALYWRCPPTGKTANYSMWHAKSTTSIRLLGPINFPLFHSQFPLEILQTSFLVLPLIPSSRVLQMFDLVSPHLAACCVPGLLLPHFGAQSGRHRATHASWPFPRLSCPTAGYRTGWKKKAPLTLQCAYLSQLPWLGLGFGTLREKARI